MSTTTEKPARAPRKSRAEMPDPLATPAPQAQPELPIEPKPVERPTKIKTYDPIEQGLALMLEKHGHVLKAAPIVTAENLATIKASHQEMVKFRTRLEAARKEEKDESLRYGRLVDAEAARIQAKASPIEQAYKKALDDYAQAEERRLAAIRARIAEVRDTPAMAIGKPLEVLEQMREACNSLDLASFEELREQAAKAQLDTLRQLDILIAQTREAEAARAAAAAREAEAKRVQEIRDRITAVRSNVGIGALARSSAMLQKLLERVTGTLIDDSYAELRAEAEQAKAETVVELQRLLAIKQQAEADAEAAKAQAEENRLLRERIARMEAEAAERQAAEQRAEMKAPEPSAAAPVDDNKDERVYFGGRGGGKAYQPLGATQAYATQEERAAAEAASTAPAPEQSRDASIEPGRELDPEVAPAVAAHEGAASDEEVQAHYEGLTTSTPLLGSTMPEDPTPREIVDLLADHFDTHPAIVVGWLQSMDFDALLAEVSEPTTSESAA